MTCTYLSFFFLVSTQALLSQRGIKCNRLFACVKNKLSHSSSQTRGHLTSLFMGNQEMKKDLFLETLFSEIWKKKSLHILCGIIQVSDIDKLIAGSSVLAFADL